ncbi:hypothetical protein H4R18_003228 [Coemansia javaensis]|uniref:Protein phosphatase n=1 Tax=Coemansia javaensis TaxID=2761396 RepID=A0A9W8H8L8_9FUNG|nr:hypothetical protein H4R18_003228 [Coemansia javaensis]
MGADSRQLSWALARLARDVCARGSAAAALGPRLGSRAAAGGEAGDGDGWAARLLRALRRGQADCDAAAQPPCMHQRGEHLTAGPEDAAGGRGQRRAQHGAGDQRRQRRRRRPWAAWQGAQSWDFPTLNASFPFTIPSVPASVFLLAPAAGHSAMPSGVIMPPGLGTAARKFHSMALTRHPGAPFGPAEDPGPAYADMAMRAAPAHLARKLSLAAARRPDGPLGGAGGLGGGGSSSRVRAPKNYMFAHAATGIPKFDNCIPLPRRAAAAAAAAAAASDSEEMAASAGEDAFFHRADAIGIADGVGGWAGQKDADPSLFARRLMHHVCREIQRYEDIDDELFSHYYDAAPVDVLRRAYDVTVDEMHALAKRGSSTACVVLLRGDELRVANLGDCGLTVVRQGDMVYRTEEQQHSFNYPYQLGTEPHSDSPSDAQVFRLKIQKGDIIIVGSDGVFDNLFDEDILEEVGHHLPPAMRAEGEPELKYSTDSLWYESQARAASATARRASATAAAAPRPKLALPQFHIDPRAISRAIAARARLVSEDAHYSESPFQLRAMQEGLYYQGGKRDDITVIVAVVTDLEDAPDRR